MLPVEVVAHSVRVGLVVADAGRDGFGPVAMRLQIGDDLGEPPGVDRHANMPLLGMTGTQG